MPGYRLTFQCTGIPTVGIRKPRCPDGPVLGSGRCLPGRDPRTMLQADAARAALPPHAARAAQPPAQVVIALTISTALQ
jgi:hypothetical protein